MGRHVGPARWADTVGQHVGPAQWASTVGWHGGPARMARGLTPLAQHGSLLLGRAGPACYSTRPCRPSPFFFSGRATGQNGRPGLLDRSRQVAPQTEPPLKVKMPPTPRLSPKIAPRAKISSKALKPLNFETTYDLPLNVGKTHSLLNKINLRN